MEFFARLRARFGRTRQPPIQSLRELRELLEASRTVEEVHAILRRLQPQPESRGQAAEIVAEFAPEIDGSAARLLMEWNGNVAGLLAEHPRLDREAVEGLLVYLRGMGAERRNPNGLLPGHTYRSARPILAGLVRHRRIAWEDPLIQRYVEAYEMQPWHTETLEVLLAHPDAPAGLFRKALEYAPAKRVEALAGLCEKGTEEELGRCWLLLARENGKEAARALERMSPERRGLLGKVDLLPLFTSSDPEVRLAALRFLGEKERGPDEGVEDRRGAPAGGLDQRPPTPSCGSGMSR